MRTFRPATRRRDSRSVAVGVSMTSSFRSHSSSPLDRAPLHSGVLESELAQAISRAKLIRTSSQRQKTRPWQKQLAIAFLNFLTGQSQIAIRPQYISGTLQWTVYDPQTDTVRQFDSERAVRNWLEQRHCQ